MKILKIFTFVVFSTILLYSCGGLAPIDYTKNDKVPEYQKENEGAPQYEITVKSDGKDIGVITVELWPNVAPQTVRNFDSLSSIKFFDGSAFHRVVDNFVIQGGDPNSKTKPKNTWGMGDPSQREIPAEFSDISHRRGILSMARKGNDINSNTSQFFICLEHVKRLDKQYTVFGQVLKGMDVVDAIVALPRSGQSPNSKIEMISVKRIK